MTEPIPDPAELRAKVADGIPPSLIDSPAVGVGTARRLKLADAMLAAVEYAGYVITTPDRLLPGDAETRTEWSVRVTMLDGRTHMALPALAPLMTQHMAEQAAARFAGPGWSNVAKAEPVSRTTSIGPWLPVSTTEES